MPVNTALSIAHSARFDLTSFNQQVGVTDGGTVTGGAAATTVTFTVIAGTSDPFDGASPATGPHQEWPAATDTHGRRHYTGSTTVSAGTLSPTAPATRCRRARRSPSP